MFDPSPVGRTMTAEPRRCRRAFKSSAVRAQVAAERQRRRSAGRLHTFSWVTSGAADAPPVSGALAFSLDAQATWVA